MATYISMIRAINVTGSNTIKMDALAKAYESLGFSNVKTYIQSGNVVFSDNNTNINELIKEIKEMIKKKFGMNVSVLIRTKREMEMIIRNNPYLLGNANFSRLYVIFMSDAPKSIPHADLENAKSNGEKFKIVGKEIYLNFPEGFGKTKLSNNYFEKKLSVVATTRNWNTVLALASMA